jgi:PTH1 family peptidyl-tRNA hydrolase
MMNLSGHATKKIADYYNIADQHIWVISDDLNLDFGVLRVRLGGSDGGHNGLKSVIENVGEDFVRFRLGIRNIHLKNQKSEKFVLKDFSANEKKQLGQFTSKASETILEYLNGDISPTTISNK